MTSHEFINWDDPYYIYNNPIVCDGLSWLGIGWAFITATASNWHPLTWLSHMLDVSLFGPTPRTVHMVNLAWYIGCVLLAFFLFLRLNASTGAAFLMAAFFGLHPLHVESVAWAAERKDLLCAFFFLAATIAYLDYARQLRRPRYFLTTGLFILALLSKPMAVTWPCVALLLDYWPLQRFNNEFRRSIYEKIPWFVLSVISSIITIIAQNKSEAIKALVDFPFTDRLANAAISYVIYIRQSFWPEDLTVFYPYPWSVNFSGILSSFLVLGFITVIAVRQRQKHPYIMWGWLFYLGVLFPVIGVIQVGGQAHADRYTLLSQLGIVLGIGLFLDKNVTDMKIRRAISMTVAVILTVLMILTFRQVSYWKDNKTLFNQNLIVTGENELAHFNLGVAYLEHNELEPAVLHFSTAAKMNPAEATTYNNLGIAYARLNKTLLAEACLKQAIILDPGAAQPHFHLAVIEMNRGNLDYAIKHLDEAARLAPEWAEVGDMRYKVMKLYSDHSLNKK
ncbi:MAG: tetratricopeptide repeat protein [Smithella sp.]